MEALSLFPELTTTKQREIPDQTTTFLDNMRLPVHRWFRFSAGFSSQWVESVISDYNLSESDTVLDPFAGSGTTLLSCQIRGVGSIGMEAHPFLARIASAKLHWTLEVDRFRDHAKRVMEIAQTNGHLSHVYPKLIHDCFPEEALGVLDSLRTAWESLDDKAPASQLSWLALTSALRASSPVGTSQMELVQPRKRKAAYLPPATAFWMQVQNMCDDMRVLASKDCRVSTRVLNVDTRTDRTLEDSSIDFVITSPPYANNYDYADATRLEMSFWGEVGGWADLQSVVRKNLVRSCSQHASADRLSLDLLLDSPEIEPIRSDLEVVCRSLDGIRAEHGGNKQYHLMIAAYFMDMARVWQQMRRVCKPNSTLCFVIGDSAPYGVYVPVQDWLGELAVSAGFKHYEFERTRDRNVKWKNRKHRVPLCEGRLWVKG